MCSRDDNLGGSIRPDDEMDFDLAQKAFYVIRERHLDCVPSFECMDDAITRFYRDCG